MMVSAQSWGQLVTPFLGEDSELEHMPSGGSRVLLQCRDPTQPAVLGLLLPLPPTSCPSS